MIMSLLGGTVDIKNIRRSKTDRQRVLTCRIASTKMGDLCMAGDDKKKEKSCEKTSKEFMQLDEYLSCLICLYINII